MLNLSGDYPVATASPFKGMGWQFGKKYCKDDDYDCSTTTTESVTYTNEEGDVNNTFNEGNKIFNNYPTPLPFKFNVNLDIKDDSDIEKLEKLIDLYINKLK